MPAATNNEPIETPEMIYRLNTPERYFGHCGPRSLHEPLTAPCPEKGAVSAREFQWSFEEVACEQPVSGCRVYRAPVLSAVRMQADLELWWRKPCYSQPLREIIVLRDRTFVSERARQVIEAHDDFGHQFHPARLLDHRGRPIDTGQPYFVMNMCRFASIDPISEGIGDEHYSDELLKLDFSAFGREWSYLPSILHDPALRERLETLPLWSHFSGDWPRYEYHYAADHTPLYLNEALLRALQQAGINGLDEYSRNGGKKAEFVAHV